VKSKFLETIKIENGSVENLFYHQKRFEAVLEQFSITEKPLLENLIHPPKEGLFRCRVVYDVKDIGAVEVGYIPYEKRVIRSLKFVEDETLEYRYKYLDRTRIDALFAQRGDSDDIVIVQNNLVRDTSIANIALFKNGRWLTPKEPLLCGTTRARLLSEKKIFEADITPKELCQAQKIALLNAMIGFDILDGCRFEF
jgi:4-amino-4-deoxychorismate lyase